MLPLRKFVLSVIAAFILLSVGQASAQTLATIEYHFPMDGSRYVPVNSQIIIRPSEPVRFVGTDIFVTGSQSGNHAYSIAFSDDGRTVIITPGNPFQSGEQVQVQIPSGVESVLGHPLTPMTFSFEAFQFVPPADTRNLVTESPSVLSFDEPQSLPSDFPSFTIATNNNPSPGALCLTSYNFTTGASGKYRMILDSLGTPKYYQKPSSFFDWDFKPIDGNRYSFCQGGYSPYSPGEHLMDAGSRDYIMDSAFVIVDSFSVSSPYMTDFHDFELLSNGHGLVLGLAIVPNVDMSQYVVGGNKNAAIMGAVIEEIDSLKNPVWIWRSWDSGHYLDTDATNDPLTEDTIDAVHANAIQQDTDGNILLSARSMDEVTKINRFDSTGALIWRLGGKHNQFQFIDDSIHFSHQHAVRRIANGHITLFDNGNYHEVNVTTIDTTQVPPDTEVNLQTFARACEYDVNTTAMTAKLVWHFDHDSTIQSDAQGYVQRLPNGNTLVTWGIYSGGFGLLAEPTVTEVDSTEKIVFEMDIEQPEVVYRAYKFPLSSPSSLVQPTVASATDLTLGEPFPNPCETSAQVLFSAPATELLQLDLYDALGRKVQGYFSNISGGVTENVEIETDGLPNGAYELVLRGKSGVVSRPLNILR